MTKVIYKSAETDAGFETHLMADDYQLKEGETLTAPTEGIMLPAHYDAATDKWTGATDEEHQAYIDKMAAEHPTEPVGPSQQDQINAMLTKQLAAVTQKGDTAQTAVVALTKQLAASQAKPEAEEAK